MGSKKDYYLKSVVTLKLNQETCIGCGLCVKVCPHEVFTIQNKKATISDRDACMECGACAQNCPVEAISVRSGVGCAAGIIKGSLSGTEPCCGPSDSSDSAKNSCCC